MPEISKLAGQITPSMTIAVTTKAKNMKKQGIDVVEFGAGEPDFDTPDNISQAGIKAIKDGLTRYTSSNGIEELRKEICEKLEMENHLKYEPNQIIVSSGAKHSISTALQAICNPGDEVIVPAPYWVSYPEMIKIIGGIPVVVKTSSDNNFRITAQQLADAVTSHTKAVIINSPGNPTGTVYSSYDLEEIAQVAVQKDIFVVSDEISEKLIYDNTEHVSIASSND